jgi:hypothetical protein
MRREDPKYVEKRKKFMAMQKEKSQDKFSKGGLKGKQKKLDKNNNNRIDAQDFKILKAEKAKGRGQGLQDEKMKPGKIMKARVGKSIRVKDDDSFSKKYELQEKGVIDKKTGTGRERVAKAVKATRVGKILLPIVGAGVAAHQFLKSKMKKDKKMGGGMIKRVSGGPAEESDLAKRRGPAGRAGQKSKPKKYKNFKVTSAIAGMLDTVTDENTPMKADRFISRVTGKMGGGMMQKPMGYKSGKSIKVACKLGKNKPTKLY